MPRCRKVRENLTAWIDGEVSASWQERIEQHLMRCSACNEEAEQLRNSIEQQRRVLPRLVEAATVDSGALLAGIRRSLAADRRAEPTPGWRFNLDWKWVLRPIPLALAAAALLLITLVEAAGGPEDVLVPIGVKRPPAAVAHKPGMFRDYAIIEKLDALENFDTVDVEPLDDDQAERG